MTGQPPSPPPAPPPPATPLGGPSAIPWYRTRFAYGLGAVLAVLLVVGALTSPAEEPAAAPVEEPEPEPTPEPEPAPEPTPEPEPAIMVAVPDFQGAYVAALEAAEEADLALRPVDEAGEYQAIFNRENWEIEAQSVDPGQQVESGTEIEVTVFRPLDQEREQQQAEREEERQQRQAEREEEGRQAQAKRDEQRQQREAEQRERDRFDYDALIEEQWSSVAQYIGSITTTATTVTVHLNMGNADEDGIVIGLDGMTDRGLAVELCAMLQAHGVHDAVDILDPRGFALVRTGAWDGQCKLT
jgi:multidrug efflux pump subunit AcrA (membrane-fusion protein)